MKIHNFVKIFHVLFPYIESLSISRHLQSWHKSYSDYPHQHVILARYKSALLKGILSTFMRITYTSISYDISYTFTMIRNVRLLEQLHLQHLTEILYLYSLTEYPYRHSNFLDLRHVNSSLHISQEVFYWIAHVLSMIHDSQTTVPKMPCRKFYVPT